MKNKIPIGWIWLGNILFGLPLLMIFCHLTNQIWVGFGGIALILWVIIFPISLMVRIGQELRQMFER